MTVFDLWNSIGAGENFFTRLLRFVILAMATAFFVFLAILPMTWPQQAVCGLLFLLLAMALARSSDSYLITLTLMLASMFCTFRYGYWRIKQVVDFFSDPGTHWGALDAFFICCLLLAEVYAFVILFLGYFQSIWPLRRAPVALPDNPEEWPHVDVIIPTYNEPLEVVRYTALGALNIDWPADKMHVYLLDDGRREEFRQFALEAGIGYRVRPDNKHAKAGNINAALKTLDSPYVAIFDSDHVPTRSFLQMTIGWFIRDPNLSMLQTPHHFYSPDPFERNLNQFHVIPNEGELFYGIVQDGNDFWNATFFCGSCAVLRRDALDDIGGVATETVTEDAHTSLRMQMNGWSTAYINIPQAAGLATERLSAHVGQRIRWARGMIQVLRTDNPLLAPGLSFPQRICYFNAMLHFLYAVPRLIFLTAPLIYLLLSHTNVPGYWAAILAYALPHLLLASVTNSRIQGEHRHSYWNEIYETVLAPYILLPTLLALINPKLGKFNVTSKGGIVRRTFFDSKIAQPFLVLLIFNIAGLILAVPRFFLWDRERPGTVLMNVLWAVFNVILLGVCTAVARELRQLRASVRINIDAPVELELADGNKVTGKTADLSAGGSCIRLDAPILYSAVASRDQVRMSFTLPGVEAALPSTVVSMEGNLLRVRFNEMSIAEQEALTMVLYSRADSWLGWGESRDPDNVLQSFQRILTISMRGLSSTFRSLFGRKEKEAPRAKGAHVVTPLWLLLAAMLTLATAAPLQAQPQGFAGAAQKAPTAANVQLPAGQFHDNFTLADTGSSQIELHGIDTQHNVYFTLPQTHVARAAKIHLNYVFSPSLIPEISHLKLMLNGTLFATVQPTPGQNGRSSAQELEADFAIPADLLVHTNTLTIEFIGHYTMVCEDPANTTLWARVHLSTAVDVTGDQLQLADDLKQLPIPFLDPAIVQPLSIPVVFPKAPSLKAVQAAGIVTSYFGMISESRPVRFPVHIGDIPQGNVILISEDSGSLPAGLNMANASGAQVAMRTNPSDPYGKALVVSGGDPEQLLRAAQAVALRSQMMSGPQVAIDAVNLPAPRSSDDAPRWARIDRKIQLWDYATAEQLQGDGTAPLNVYFRIPPDLFFGDKPNATLKVAYRYNSIPIGPISSMQVRINNAFLGSVPLIPGQEASRRTDKELPVPIVNLRPFSNTLAFDFTFQLLKKAGCQDTTPINMQGSILRDSYLDLSEYSHWAAMPNLEIFANAGFPFTRFADLSRTTVVLPAQPTAQEVELFVTLMAHFSRQTGVPALRVSVEDASALREGESKDFLVIGIGDDQPGFDKLANRLPVALSTGQVLVRDTQAFFIPILHHAWWKVRSGEHEESGQLTMGGSVPDAILEGIESPFQKVRTFLSLGQSSKYSLVAIRLKDASVFEPFLVNFLKDQQGSDIAGSVTVLHGDQFQSFRIGANVYHVGELPWWKQLMLFLAQVPWVVAVAVVLLFLVMSMWLRQWLRYRARARLRMLQD